jgi:hypothetical protein
MFFNIIASPDAGFGAECLNTTGKSTLIHTPYKPPHLQHPTPVIHLFKSVVPTSHQSIHSTSTSIIQGEMQVKTTVCTRVQAKSENETDQTIPTKTNTDRKRLERMFSPKHQIKETNHRIAEARTLI